MKKKSPEDENLSKRRSSFLLLRQEVGEVIGIGNEGWSKQNRDLLASKFDGILLDDDTEDAERALPAETTMLNLIGLNKAYEQKQSVPRVEFLNLMAKVAGYENWFDFFESKQKGPGPEKGRRKSPTLSLISCVLGGVFSVLVLWYPQNRLVIGMGWSWMVAIIMLAGITPWFLMKVGDRPGLKGIWRHLSRASHRFANWGWVFSVLAIFQLSQLVLFRPVRLSFHNPTSDSMPEKVLVEWDRWGEQVPVTELSKSESKVVWMPVGENGLLLRFFDLNYPMGDRISLSPGLNAYNYEIRY